MGSPCEILIDSDDERLANTLCKLVRDEALRIEHKYSRYRVDSVLSLINASRGHPVTADAETAQLLDYAEQCHRLSDGKFDITSGVLRAQQPRLRRAFGASRWRLARATRRGAWVTSVFTREG